MKKISYLLMMLFVATLSIGFTSCSSDDDDSSNTGGYDADGNPVLVGTWYYDSNEDDDWDSKNYSRQETLVFNANGTGTISLTETEKGSPSSTSNGSFNYILTWDNHIGRLIITDQKGQISNIEGTYSINGSGSIILTTSTFKIFGRTYQRK